ncbi:MAG: hypothetical protein ACT4N2_03000 [Hyphomicrobium sp.]
MAYASDATTTRGQKSRSGTLDFSPEVGGGWAEPEKPPRDLKKMFLVAGLGILSWVATYVGMLELIEANMGELPLVHKAIIGFSVAMLMTMIIWLLDQMFAPINAFTKLCYFAGYVFLTVISVGFGFGFYWKVLESRSESSRSAESAVAQVQGSLHAASTRLEQLNITLVQLATLSSEKADLERAKGTSCPNSKPGDGPRRKLREDDAARFSFASEFVKGRVGAVRSDLEGLNGDLALITKDDKSIVDAKSGTRNEFMKGLGRKLDMTVTGFNAFRTDPQLRQLRSDLDARADQTTFGDPKKGGFVCPDPQLQQALKGAVRAIDQLPELQKPAIAAVEGSEATIEAFRRLTATFYGMLSFKLPPSADELRELQQKAVQSVEGAGAAQRALSIEGAGLSKRDYVPLAIAMFVDLCLLLVSMGRPMHRLNGLVPKMREAERGPVIQILSRFNEIHRDPEIRQNFDLFRHVVFDYHGDYYVAVPLDAPKRMNPDARIELQHEAHLLANLFSSFEKERIFKRVYNPLLQASAVQKRLRRQGSKFAECEAFRTYRFRDGAWSEIILGAVMGAARRVEAAKHRRMVEDELAGIVREPDLGVTRSQVRPPYAVPQPGSAGEPAFGRSRQGGTSGRGETARGTSDNGHGIGSDLGDVRMPDSVRAAINGRTRAATYGQPSRTEAPQTRPTQQQPLSTGSIRADFTAGYGPYDRAAQAELHASSIEAAHDVEVSVHAANSNTAPGSRSSPRRPADRHAEPSPASETVVPFNGVRPRPTARPSTPGGDAQAAGPATVVEATTFTPVTNALKLQPQPEADGKIDVVLSRETATLRVPYAETPFPDALIDRLGRALAETRPADAMPALAPIVATAEVLTPVLLDFDEDVQEPVGPDLRSDPATDDAIPMAGRLRPAIPAE